MCENEMLRFERVTGTAHGMYEQALALYRNSFPDHEQREAASQTAILADAAYHFDLIWDGDTFVGLLLNWEAEEFIYVEHFCILPELRNRRYGQRALEMLGQRGKQVILEIDPPVDGIALRRKGFYERCGFTANPWEHVHPPYHRGNAGHTLVLMSCPGKISPEACAAFQRYLAERVMGNAFA